MCVRLGTDSLLLRPDLEYCTDLKDTFLSLLISMRAPGAQGIAWRASLVIEGAMGALHGLAVHGTAPKSVQLNALLWCVHPCSPLGSEHERRDRQALGT